MTKGETTREMILSRAAPVFNRLGFAGASLADIMAATGLEKGGIYNHFRSKEELAVEAFDYAITQVGRAMVNAFRGLPTGYDRLAALIRFFTDYYEHPPVAGGCPVLNTAVESDDSNPALRERAQRGMDQMRQLFITLIERGIRDGSIRPEVDARAAADLLVASLEGGLVMSKLYGASEHINRVVGFLVGYAEQNYRA